MKIILKRGTDVRKFAIPLILLILIGLQNSLFEYIKILGVKPDIALVFIISFSLIRGNPWGTVIGIAGGIFEDVFFPGAFGINSLACMLTAFLIGNVETKIYKDNIFVPGLFAFGGTMIKELIVYLFLYLTRTNINLVMVLTNTIIPEAIYNTILIIVFYRYVVKFSSKFLSQQTWRI